MKSKHLETETAKNCLWFHSQSIIFHHIGALCAIGISRPWDKDYPLEKGLVDLYM